MHGEEVGRVVELGDQGQFVVELAGDGVGDAVGVGAGGAVPGEGFQGLLGCLAGDADLGGVLVAQLVEREAAAVGDFERAGDGVRVAGKQAGDFFRGFQVAVGDALAAEAGVVDRAAVSDAGEHVLQDAAPGGVVEHVAGGDGGDVFRCGEVGELLQTGRVVGAAVQGQGEVGSAGEVGAQAGEVGAGGGVRGVGQQDGEQAVGVGGEIRPGEGAGTLAGAALADGEQAA